MPASIFQGLTPGTPDVAIIGGGCAGLSAAAALAERGAKVTVLDARPQLGGRATAFVDRDTGELVDNGQHVLFGCYRETLAFLHRIGADDHVRLQPALSVPYIDTIGRRSVLTCPPLPAPFHLLAAILDWDAMPWRERLSALRLAGPMRRARRDLRRTASRRRPPADDAETGEESRRVTGASQTVAEWLTAHRQGRKLRAWLWEPLAIAALNQSPETASAAPFVRVLAEMFGPDPSASALVMPTRPLHAMYAEPARDYITAHGGDVRSNALARVVVERDRVTGVDVRGERMAAGALISAVPWYELRHLFTPATPGALASIVDRASAMESMPIVTVNLWYDRPVMDDMFVALPGRMMQFVFDKRLAFGGEASHLSVISSAATTLAAMARETLVALAAREIESALPGARTARLLHGTVIRERQATFSLAPGQPTRPGTETPIPNLFLAGDWVDTGLPGTIESAVISGHRAAASVG